MRCGRPRRRRAPPWFPPAQGPCDRRFRRALRPSDSGLGRRFLSARPHAGSARYDDTGPRCAHRLRACRARGLCFSQAPLLPYARKAYGPDRDRARWPRSDPRSGRARGLWCGQSAPLRAYASSACGNGRLRRQETPGSYGKGGESFSRARSCRDRAGIRPAENRTRRKRPVLRFRRNTPHRPKAARAPAPACPRVSRCAWFVPSFALRAV